MAGIAAVNQLGESIVGMLLARRNLLAAEGKLAPLSASLDITQLPLSKFAVGTEPTTGLTLTCLRIQQSDYATPRVAPRDPNAATISLEVSYLLTAWGAGAVGDEQTILTWAMLELTARPLLDRSVLIGPAGTWLPEETVQIVPDSQSDDAMYRLWGALQHKYRCSAYIRARVLRIGYGPGNDWPPVVATRFGLAPVDDVLVSS
jgi:hypothetical protein